MVYQLLLITGLRERNMCVNNGSLQVLKDSGMMEEREYETYRSLFSNMSNFMYVLFINVSCRTGVIYIVSFIRSFLIVLRWNPSPEMWTLLY